MSEYTLGVLTIPALIVAVAVLAAAGWLVARVWPVHWSLAGPQRRSADVRRVFRWVNARGRHVSTFRRLASVGPFALYVARYRPGHVDEEERSAA